MCVFVTEVKYGSTKMEILNILYKYSKSGTIADVLMPVLTMVINETC